MFFLVALLIVFLLHLYIWLHLVKRPAFSRIWTRRGSVVIILLGVSLPSVFFIWRVMPIQVGRILTFPIYVWVGMLLILLPLLVLSDFLRVAFALGRRWQAKKKPAQPFDPGRREMLNRSMAGFVGIGSLSVGGLALEQGLGKPVVKEVEIELDRLPPAMDGFTIVQLTDLHVGPTITRDRVVDVVERTNAIHPDLIVITGDIVDGTVEQLREEVAPLGQLHARYGVYGVTGNHEFYSGIEPWLIELNQLGIRMLENEKVIIGEGEKSFELAGVHDLAGKRRKHGPLADLAKAVKGRDPHKTLILLAHQPKVVEEALTHGVDLQLSGHTHGGQIWPWHYFIYLLHPYRAGLHLHKGTTQIYVSSGTGYWGPPLRLGTEAEISKLILRSSPKKANNAQTK